MALTSIGIKWILASLILLYTLPVLAQETILVTSQTATGTGGESTYSVGQVAFSTVESAAGTVTQGVQQPYEILFMTGLEESPDILLSCEVFPNPATAEVRLKIEREELSSLRFQLRNNHGSLISEQAIAEKTTLIPLNELSAGTYLLTLFDGNTNLKTWKVIKK